MTDTTTRPPQEKVCGYEYTVRRGDSFYLIAHRLGIPLRDLLEANADINPARLMVGDVLCIPMEEDDAPQPPVITPAPDEPEADDSLDRPAEPESGAVDEEMAVCPEADRRTVNTGETISDIQLSANLNRRTLEMANPDTDLDALSAGQVLCVPQENIACRTATTYTVGQEDTLESIALQWNVSVGALLRSNPCLAPSDFAAGVCVTIPSRG
ncbi:MAG: LysM peptidoglycan-binding domain-containing protein [Clostridiales bacterium]|nr:LysM peptidoglycan-binding domain-containing protein [Clostridiales bacterium]